MEDYSGILFIGGFIALFFVWLTMKLPWWGIALVTAGITLGLGPIFAGAYIIALLLAFLVFGDPKKAKREKQEAKKQEEREQLKNEIRQELQQEPK